jgi:hypothetical protein
MRPIGLYIEKGVRTVMSVRLVMVPPSAWPRKSGHRCDHCGSDRHHVQLGLARDGIWLHSRCEEAWHDSGGRLP